MINFLRLPPNENVMTHLYNTYFKPFIDRLVKKYDFAFFYKVIDSKCTKCGLIKSSNHFL